MSKKLTYSLACFFTAFFIQGISQQYKFINYSTAQGLSQSQVNSVVQDSEHNLWIATLDGLSKFDGKTFSNFYKDQGLSSNTINALFCDSLNRIWIGTSEGLNYIYKNSVYPVNLKDYSQYKVNAIYVLNHFIYIGLAKDIVLKISVHENPTNTLVKSMEVYTLPEKTSVNSISSIQNSIYISTRKGVYTLSDRLSRVSFIDSTLNCTNIKEDLSHTIWLSTLEQGVFKFKEGKSAHYKSENELNIPNNYVRDLIVDHQNNVWFCTKVGLTKIAGNTITNYIGTNGFDYVAESILEDAEGNIWIGTEGKGIVRFVNESFSFLTAKQGLHSDLILSFCEDKEGAIWLSSYGSGVARLYGNQFTLYSFQNNTLSNNTVWSSFKSSDGTLFFGTSDGLDVFKNNRFYHYKTEDGLLNNKIQSFFEDNDSTVYIGTKEGVVSYKNGKISSFLTNIWDVRSIVLYQNSICFASSDGIYITTKNKPPKKIGDELLLNKTVYCLASYKKELWIGADDGLYKYFNGSIQKVKTSIKNSNSSAINFLHIDRENTLWVGVNNGIYRKNLEDEDTPFTILTTDDGLIGLETNLNAIYEDSKGKIWIGTSEGVSIYNPKDKTSRLDYKLKISLNEVKLFYETENWVDSARFKFDYNRNHISFYFNAPFYQKPNNVYYQYKLEGFDENWTPPDFTNFTRYSNVPPGHYTFKVKASYDLKNWTSEASYSFTIKTPFWLTWWFRIGFLLLLFGLTYYFFLRQKKRQNEKRKAAILEYKNRLVKLEQQSLNASMNRHFIFNALNSIQFYINKEDKLSANRYLSSFAKLIRKNLDSSINEDSLISLEEELDRLKLYMSLEKMRFKDRFDYKIEVDPEIDLEMNKVPGMFLQPFVENSIWHGILPNDEKEGLITISIKKHNEGFQFIIEDNGIGIETSKKAKELNPNSHISRGMEIASNRIAMLEKISGQNITLKGPYEIIENQEVKGTRVEVTFG